MLEEYLKNLFKVAKAGDAREESYYSSLERLFDDWIKQAKKKYLVTVLPKKTEGGNPDFRVWDGKGKIIGYVEAKPPEKINLEPIEDSEQLKRYRETFPNLILTNFFEYRLYRHGQLINRVKIGQPLIAHKIKVAPPAINYKEFDQLLEQFFAFSTPRTATAKQLATELAKRTRFLRDEVITQELEEENIEGTQTLEGYYSAFKDHLIPSLTLQDFSNLFAQTITYGLFAARSRAGTNFNRKVAYDYVPNTIGILRDLFRFISSADLPRALEWIVDDIAEVLAVSDVKKIMDNFYKENKGRDPIVHFYETFLVEYDPKEREKRGVYYTPEPVVGYIVRSIHKLLKEKFSKEDGFATSSVTVLDPAAGTLTFPAEAIRLATSEYKAKYGDGGVGGLISDHILKNFYSFELMMAPYAVGHLKIGFILDELGHKLKANERFNLFLTNTLDFTREDPNNLGGIFEKMIAKESQEALKVKEEIPIMVVMGNPPYSGVSENASEFIRIVSKGQSYKSTSGKEKIATKIIKLKQKTFIGQLIEDYKQIDGQPLGEQKHWLQDDYVKFYRFAQWKIEQAGSGVLGFITNHAWLDNPTFRGMRRSLMQSFDEIYLLNLHGSKLKKEKNPQGGKDENVFDIQTGVAVGVFIKYQKPSGDKKIVYADQWGLREEKYAWLDANDLSKTKWTELRPNLPFYFFVPRKETGREEYEKFRKITEIFPVNSTGILTGRDDFVIDFDKRELEARIRVFRDSRDSDELIKQAYGLKDKPNYKWFVSESRKELQKLPDYEKHFTKILYRPFDERWIYYHPSVVFWPREDVMRPMLKSNLALIACRQLSSSKFQHALISPTIADDSLVSNKTKERGYVFPLYLYPNSGRKKQNSLFEGDQPMRADSKTPNIDQKFSNFVEDIYKTKIEPEAMLYYVYAILYSDIYRSKYQEFLKIDFPRIPFTKDFKLFKKVSDLGQALVNLHLMKAVETTKSLSKFQGKNGNKVEKRIYNEKQKRVYINENQYFEGIGPEVWNYYIGGYQVLDKWLKDRKGRILSSEDIKHYCKVVTIISKTIEIQKKVDKLYPEVEQSIIEKS